MKSSIFSLKTKITVFIINLLTLLFIGFIQYTNQFNSLKEEFDFNIENIVKKQLSDDISSTKGVITSLASFYHTNNEMNTSDFSIFSHDLISKYKFINSIGFATIVKDNEKQQFEDSLRDEGLYDFYIKSYDRKTGKFTKSKNKNIYGPIIYMEPASYKYTRYYGFDILNEISFHDSFLKASKNGSVEIIDRLRNERSDMMNIFIKATYDDFSLKNVNGFFIIDIDMQIVLKRLRERFGNYTIKIIGKKEFEQYKKVSLENRKHLFKDLIYLSKIDHFTNSYFYITKKVKFYDFNLKVFFVILFLVMLIQLLFVIVWQKDKVGKRKLSYRASHDDLTGLINRLYFRKSFEKIIQKSIFKNSDALTAILFIDIDRFKEVNDSFGHTFGDEVLVEIASRFKSVMHNNDIICRHGGDEFIILVDGIKNTENLIKIVKKIMNTMNTPVHKNKQKLHLTLSIGISLYPNDGKTIDDLLKNADSALFKAKDEGRNTYRFYTKEMSLEVMQKVVLENKIRDAIKNDEFIVYFQPQFDGRDNSIIGMEALVRWKNEDGEIIPPSKFIPLVEETGLIINFDQLIMKKAIKQFSSWNNRGLNPAALSLNLSMKQLKNNDFIPFLKEVLYANNCSANLIELEVTETQIMENPNEAIEKLEEISSLGIKLSVDDFGTGYSSLAYLKKLPINKLKIDRTFIKDLPMDEEDIAISKSIIALSQNLKLDVIAEGVETKEQRDFLINNGCFKIQGFYYSKPLSAKDMENLLRK